MITTTRSRIGGGPTLVAACLALFAIFLDSTIVNVALPTIQHALGSAPEGLEWIVNAYIVAFAGLVLLGGALGDRLGRRRMFVTGLVIFAAASAVGAITTTMGVLIGARAVQGVGAALLAPLSLSLLTHAFPREKLPAAIGVWAGVSGLGLAVGPLVGGYLVEQFGWHSVFWVIVPIAVSAALLTALGVHEPRDTTHQPVDALGASLVTAGLVGVVAGLTRSVRHPWTSPVTLALLGAGAVLVAAFVAQQRRSPAPLLPVTGLRSPRLRAGVAVLTLASFALLGAIWFVALYLQNVRGYSAVQAGIRTLPLTATTLFVAPIAGKIAGRRGPRPVLITGLGLTLAALVALAFLDTGTPYTVFAADLIALGTGLALALPTAAALVLDGASADQVGSVSALATMARQFGGAVGVAVLASTGGRIAVEAFHQATQAPNRLDDLVAGGQVALIGRVAGASAQHAAAAAFLHGFTTVMWTGAAAVAVALVAAVALTAERRDRERTLPVPAATPEQASTAVGSLALPQEGG